MLWNKIVCELGLDETAKERLKIVGIFLGSVFLVGFILFTVLVILTLLRPWFESCSQSYQELPLSRYSIWPCVDCFISVESADNEFLISSSSGQEQYSICIMKVPFSSYSKKENLRFLCKGHGVLKFVGTSFTSATQYRAESKDNLVLSYNFESWYVYVQDCNIYVFSQK